MQVWQSSDDLLYNLQELRPSDAIRSFRRSIIEDYPGDRCAYCGRKANSWTLDHIIPRSKGGPNRRWNLTRCCTHCNGSKSAELVLPWWRPKNFWDEEREETLFHWMRENATIDSMSALEDSLKKGSLDKDALEDLKASDIGKPTFWDSYCEVYPSEPECLIYDV